MSVRVLQGDCRTVLTTLPPASVHCCVKNDGRFKPGQHWRPHGRHREKAWLEEQYVGLRRSTGDIAKEIGFQDATVLFWLNKHGIERRTISEARALKKWSTPSGVANPMFGRTGEANPNYVDGSSPWRQRAYVQSMGRAFLRAIYKRDGYRCVRCGSPKIRSKWLHVHHIAPWAGNVGLRFDPTNAVTLCRVCHSWVHSKVNTAREFIA